MKKRGRGNRSKTPLNYSGKDGRASSPLHKEPCLEREEVGSPMARSRTKSKTALQPNTTANSTTSNHPKNSGGNSGTNTKNSYRDSTAIVRSIHNGSSRSPSPTPVLEIDREEDVIIASRMSKKGSKKETMRGRYSGDAKVSNSSRKSDRHSGSDHHHHHLHNTLQPRTSGRSTYANSNRGSAGKDENYRTDGPTPLPRRNVVLTSTPAFLKGVKGTTESENTDRGYRTRSTSPVPRLARRAIDIFSPVGNHIARGFSHLRELSRGNYSVRPAQPQPSTRYSVRDMDTPDLSAIRNSGGYVSSQRFSIASSNSSGFLRQETKTNLFPKYSEVISNGSGVPLGPSVHRYSNLHKGTSSSSSGGTKAGGDGADDVVGPRYPISNLSDSLSNLASSSRSSRVSSARNIGRNNTLADPDVSPIEKVNHIDSVVQRRYVMHETNPQQRADHDSKGRPLGSLATNLGSTKTSKKGLTPPIPLSTAPEVVREGAVERASMSKSHFVDGRSGSDGSRPPPLYVPMLSDETYNRIGKVTRAICSICILVCMCLVMASYSAAMVLQRHGVENVLTRLYVSTEPELHVLYQTPAASLSREDVERLYLRSLSEGIDRLERATMHLIPSDDTPHRKRVLYFTQMVHAYLYLRHSCLMYARSRDASRWRRLLWYGVSDAWEYGVGRRHPMHSSLLSAIIPTPPLEFAERLWSSARCFTQQELLPCVSLEVWKQQMLREAVEEGAKYYDVNAAWESEERRFKRLQRQARLIPNMDSEVYLSTLLEYIRTKTREGTRKYNDI